MVAVFLPGRSGAVVNGSPSGFESNDGNMTVEGTTNSADWNCFANGAVPGFASGINPGTGKCSTALVPANAVALHPDASNGASGEVTWKAGQKLDNTCPTLLNNGSVPNKDDFTDVASYNEVDSATPPNTFLYGAEIRAVANGNSSGNLELNQVQGPTPPTCSSSIVRTAGDKLLAFDFLTGGTTLDFHALTWITPDQPNLGGNNGTCDISNHSLPCWGANVVTSGPGITIGGCNSLTANDVEGCSNQSPILKGDNGLSNTALDAQQFAEFGVNLTKVLGLTGCFSFPQEVWESRSSGSSFTSNPEDIEIEHHKINNCGEIKIIKQTDARGTNQDFSFTSTIPSPGTSNPATPSCTQSPSNPTSFTLNDKLNTGKTLGSTDPAQNSAANTQDCTNVVRGTYTVSEGAEPNGFTYESLTCTADATSGSTVTPSSSTTIKTATINLKPLGLVTCVYINQLNTATLATSVSTAGPVFPSVPVHDTATVTGNQAADTPSGTVTFFLCGPISGGSGSCSSGGTNIGTGTLSGSGATASATSTDVNTSASPLTPGFYCFRAEWPGDTNYPTALTEFGGTSGTNECFTVQVIPTTTTTTPSVGSGGTTNFGSSVTDHAVVKATQPGGGSPTGTVTFFICDPTQLSNGACPTGGTQVGNPVMTTDLMTSPLPSSFADSSAFMVNKTGIWCFRAVYTPGGANGANYTGSSDASSGECFTVTDTTGSTSAQTWLPNDTAIVAAAHGAPLNGTLSAQLSTDGTCSALVSDQLYTKTLTNATSAADRTLTTANTTFPVITSTSVSWLVTFTSSDPNVTSSMHCEVTSLTITN
jgi:hypothetical protein